MALTREQIKAKRGIRPREAVDVPELGGVLYVARMTARERDDFEFMVTGGKVGVTQTPRNIRARFLTLVCLNEDGTRMFEEADAEWLGELDTEAVQKIVDVGFRLNGIGSNALEEAAKN